MAIYGINVPRHNALQQGRESWDPDTLLDPSLPMTADWGEYDVEDDLDELDLATASAPGVFGIEDWYGDDDDDGDDDDYGDGDDDWLGDDGNQSDEDIVFGDDEDLLGDDDDEIGWGRRRRRRRAYRTSKPRRGGGRRRAWRRKRRDARKTGRRLKREFRKAHGYKRKAGIFRPKVRRERAQEFATWMQERQGDQMGEDEIDLIGELDLLGELDGDDEDLLGIENWSVPDEDNEEPEPSVRQQGERTGSVANLRNERQLELQRRFGAEEYPSDDDLGFLPLQFVAPRHGARRGGPPGSIGTRVRRAERKLARDRLIRPRLLRCLDRDKDRIIKRLTAGRGERRTARLQDLLGRINAILDATKVIS